MCSEHSTSILIVVQPGGAGRPVTARDRERIREAVLGLQRTSPVSSPDALPSDEELDEAVSAARRLAPFVAQTLSPEDLEQSPEPGSRTFFVDVQGRILATRDTPFPGEEPGAAS